MYITQCGYNSCHTIYSTYNSCYRYILCFSLTCDLLLEKKNLGFSLLRFHSLLFPNGAGLVWPWGHVCTLLSFVAADISLWVTSTWGLRERRSRKWSVNSSKIAKYNLYVYTWIIVIEPVRTDQEHEAEQVERFGSTPNGTSAWSYILIIDTMKARIKCTYRNSMGHVNHSCQWIKVSSLEMLSYSQEDWLSVLSFLFHIQVWMQSNQCTIELFFCYLSSKMTMISLYICS